MINIIDIIFYFNYNLGMNNKLEIGKEIRNRRLELNIRMDDVCKAIGITRSTLSSIENGEGNYTIDILIKILSYFDMSINVESQIKELFRKRATRTNNIIDKKINRFIVMCVEQYSAYINTPSKEVYKEMNDKGIINELKDDYEDMHGMPMDFINEYISKRLIGGKI